MEEYSIENLVKSLCDPQIPDLLFDTELDLENQRVITMDVARTKSDILTPEERLLLEKMLTYYCKTENISYKQGINEILAPFLLLNRSNIPLSVCYNCFKNFVKKFIPTLFANDDFRPLHGLFMITKLILKYHIPEISICFSNNEITPDIYMTTWYVTMFSSRIKDLNLLYIFWEALINKNDPLYISYFGIALLNFYKSDIKSQDHLNFPSVFKKITIPTYEILALLLQTADYISYNMPATVESLLKKYDMYNLTKIDSFERLLEKNICLLILPEEIIRQTYPHDLVCDCNNKRTCKIKKLNHILLDCRFYNDHKQGFFLNSYTIPKIANKDPRKLSDYPSNFLSLRNTYHIALMGTGVPNESDLVLDVYQNFTQYEFPYVSIVEGGYQACHDYALKHNLLIEKHNPKICKACTADKKVIIESTLDKFFRLKSNKQSPNENIIESFDNSKKLFRCKIDQDIDLENSEFGLIVTSKKILLFNVKTKQLRESIEISKLRSIISDREHQEVLKLSFTNSNTKKTLILDPKDLKEFLTEVKESFKAVKNFSNSVLNLV